jgi:hypothetical protein
VGNGESKLKVSIQPFRPIAHPTTIGENLRKKRKSQGIVININKI